MSNIGKNAHFMELQIDENRHLLGKGLPLEANDEEGFKAIKRSFRETIMYIFRSQAIYVLLPSVPAALICGKLGLGPSVVFWTNCFAIIPLAALLCFATEELALHTGETIGGLLNATFGNAVEIIVSVFALREGQIRIVQASMLGSILSNLLLVRICPTLRLEMEVLTWCKGSWMLLCLGWKKSPGTRVQRYYCRCHVVAHGCCQRFVDSTSCLPHDA